MELDYGLLASFLTVIFMGLQIQHRLDMSKDISDIHRRITNLECEHWDLVQYLKLQKGSGYQKEKR